jgi:hypothetical protein
MLSTDGSSNRSASRWASSGLHAGHFRDALAIELGSQGQGGGAGMGRVLAAGVRDHEAPLFHDFLVFDHPAFGKYDPAGLGGEQGFDHQPVPVR